MNFADLDLSQSAFLDPGQLPWSERKTYNGINSSPAVDAKLFASQSQLHAQPQRSAFEDAYEFSTAVHQSGSRE